MIEFFGEISGNCMKEALREERLIGFYSSLIVAIPQIIAAIILAILFNLVFLIWIAGMIIYIFLASRKITPKTYSLILPSKVTFDNGLIIAESEKFSISRNFEHIKLIYDMGDWYKIKFYFPYHSTRFRCQKNLIMKGSIADFERMFSAKIIRRDTTR